MCDMLLLGTFTDDGAAALARQAERIAAVNAELERLGVEMRQAWSATDDYDFVALVAAHPATRFDGVVAAVAARLPVRLSFVPVNPVATLASAEWVVGAPIPVPLD